MDKIAVIIVAAGKGTRMGTAIKKQYILLEEKEVLAHTIEKFNNLEEIGEIILVVSKEDIEFVNTGICKKYHLNKVSHIVAGGKERQESVANGLEYIQGSYRYVLVHDGARPLITKEMIKKCIDEVKQKKACIVAVPVKDTIKVCDIENKEILSTPNRSTLWAVQTPQIFEKEILEKAYKYAKEQDILGTDDSMLVEALGYKVYCIEGEYTNIKITTKEDVLLAQNLMATGLK